MTPSRDARRPGRAGLPRRPGRAAGLALADFLAGTLILTGSVGATFTLLHAKFDLIRATDARLEAQAACEAELDRVRTRGLPGLPTGEATVEGFRTVATFAPPEARLAGAEGRIEARALRLEGGEPHDLYEVRVTVSWRDGGGQGRVALSTVAPLPRGEEGQ